MVLQQLQNSQHNIIDIAKARSFRFLCVMQSTAPVDADLWRLLVELHSRCDRAAGWKLTELVEAIEHRTVFADVETLHLFAVLVHIVGSDRAQEADVLVRVELCHLVLRRLVRTVDFHLSVETVVEEEVVGHANAVRLHRMALAVVVVADVT